MYTNIYVDIGASGANDGTSWTDAYNTADGIKDAIDEFDGVANYDIWVKPGPYTITQTIPVDAGAPTGTETNRCRVIGCDASGNEIASRGTWIDVDANGGAFPVVTFSGTVQRVIFKHFHFHNTDKNSNNCALSMTGLGSTDCYGIGFINCKFGEAYRSIDSNDGDVRCPFFIDCEFVSDASGTYTYLGATVGGAFIRCYFKAASGDGYAAYDINSNGPLYYGCVFDANGESYGIRSSGSYMSHFINCVAINFTVGAFYSNNRNWFNCINTIAHGNDAANDHALYLTHTADSGAAVSLNCISNITNSNGISQFTDFEEPLYGVASSIDSSSGDVINDSGDASGDYQWNIINEALNGFQDRNSMPTKIGVGNLSPADYLSRINEQANGSPVTGSF